MAKIIKEVRNNERTVSKDTVRQFSSLALAQANWSNMRKMFEKEIGYKLDGSYCFSVFKNNERSMFYVTCK